MWPDSMQGILAPRTDEVQRRDLALKVQGAGNAKKTENTNQKQCEGGSTSIGAVRVDDEYWTSGCN
jgi:hypothetical protein